MHKNQIASALNKPCCRYHPNSYLVEDRICSECGLEVMQDICFSAEWRKFADDDKNQEKSRVGAAENYLLSSGANLSTSIESTSGCSSYGKTIVKQFARRSVDKALVAAFKRIDTMADRINLPDSVKSHTKFIYQRQMKERCLKGNIMSSDAKVAACLFIACQEQGVPRTLREITAIAEESCKEIRDAIHLINRVLKREVKPIAPADLLSRFCAKLFLPHSVAKQAKTILSSFENEKALQNAFPESAAATSIYLAANDKATRKEICEQAGITAQTVSRLVSLVSK